MVLLTSSAISVVISSTIVCSFTFLLFLSGYVLQQQTVKSLQEALHRPVEPRPTPYLPKAFQKNRQNETDSTLSEELDVVELFDSIVADVSATGQYLDQIQVAILPEGEHESPSIGSINEEASDLPLETKQPETVKLEKTLPPERLAYYLTIPNPSDLCSAVLFAKWQRKNSRLKVQPSIVFFYPATWETGSTSPFTNAVELLRDVQEDLSIIYHPVMISSIWEGVAVEPQLLSELQSHRWDYDRALYLRSPGFAFDTLKLDTVLASSNLKKSWALKKSSSRTYPDMLMLSAAKGIFTPRNELRQLTISASDIESHYLERKTSLVEAMGETAYIYFDEAYQQNHQYEYRQSGQIFEKFEREQKNLCSSRGLLDNHEEET